MTLVGGGEPLQAVHGGSSGPMSYVGRVGSGFHQTPGELPIWCELNRMKRGRVLTDVAGALIAGTGG
jgi:hypothetical protein